MKMATHRLLEISFSEAVEKDLPSNIVQNNAPLPFSASPVLWAPVVSAKNLTYGEDVKTVIDLGLDISEMGYEPIPGDTIGILPKNSPQKIQQLFKRLRIDNDAANKICKINVVKSSSKKNASLSAFIPNESTLHHIFETCVDLNSVPKKMFLKSLLDYTTDPNDQLFIQSLCSKEGNAYSDWVASGEANIFKLLDHCPSCEPPTSVFLEHLPRLLPRPYSIAYTSGKAKNLHVVFSVLKSQNKALGLCSGWLEALTKPLHSPEVDILSGIQNMSLEGTACKEKVPIFFRKSNGFSLPEDPLKPLIMVGCGTGVAPFVGFLQQRQSLVDKNGINTIGESWLFFGCRYSDRDHIFQTEMMKYKKQGALSNYITSFSRQPHPSKYVQDNIKIYGKQVCDILLERKGVIYVCGDSVTMGKDVKECVRNEIAKQKGLTIEDANELLKSLVSAKQYKEDLWS